MSFPIIFITILLVSTAMYIHHIWKTEEPSPESSELKIQAPESSALKIQAPTNIEKSTSNTSSALEQFPDEMIVQILSYLEKLNPIRETSRRLYHVSLHLYAKKTRYRINPNVWKSLPIFNMCFLNEILFSALKSLNLNYHHLAAPHKILVKGAPLRQLVSVFNPDESRYQNSAFLALSENGSVLTCLIRNPLSLPKHKINAILLGDMPNPQTQIVYFITTENILRYNFSSTLDRAAIPEFTGDVPYSLPQKIVYSYSIHNTCFFILKDNTLYRMNPKTENIEKHPCFEKVHQLTPSFPNHNMALIETPKNFIVMDSTDFCHTNQPNSPKYTIDKTLYTPFAFSTEDLKDIFLFYPKNGKDAFALCYSEIKQRIDKLTLEFVNLSKEIINIEQYDCISSTHFSYAAIKLIHKYNKTLLSYKTREEKDNVLSVTMTSAPPKEKHHEMYLNICSPELKQACLSIEHKKLFQPI